MIGSAAREELSGLAPELRGRSAKVAQLILQAIQTDIPAYSRPLEGRFGKAIVEGIRRGVDEFLDRLFDPDHAERGTAELFRMLGTYEVSEGRGIDVLHSACRIGGRVGWQTLSEAGIRGGLPVATMCELAAALFDYIDELSSLSHQGYLAAQSRAAGALERRRKRLLDRLLSAPPPSDDELVALAGDARWPVPSRVVVLLPEPEATGGDATGEAYPDFAADVLVDLESEQPCLVVPADHVDDVLTELRGLRVVVGPVVEPAAGHDSLRLARQAAALADESVLGPSGGDPADAVIRCDDHLAALWLLADPNLARHLVRSAMEPLEDLNVKQRERLAETLSAWLETRGGAPEVAAVLAVHPQTVRYRIHQLEALYGERLRDASARFSITAALRARRLRPSLDG